MVSGVFNFAGMRIYENYTTTAVSLRAGCCSLFDKTEFIELVLTAPKAPLVRGGLWCSAYLLDKFEFVKLCCSFTVTIDIFTYNPLLEKECGGIPESEHAAVVDFLHFHHLQV